MKPGYNSEQYKLVEEFKERLPKDKENLAKLLEITLKKYLQFIRENPSTRIEDKKDFERRYIIGVAERIMDNNLDCIESELIKDYNFERLRMKSGNIFKIACEKLRGQNAEESIDVDKEIEQLNELLQKVEPFNYREAEKLLSEAILDARFIEDPNTNMESIRLHWERERLKSESKEGVEK